MMPATVHGMIPAALAGPGFIEHHRGSCRFGLMTRAKSRAGLAQLEGSGVPLPKVRPEGVPQSAVKCETAIIFTVSRYVAIIAFFIVDCTRFGSLSFVTGNLPQEGYALKEREADADQCAEVDDRPIGIALGEVIPDAWGPPDGLVGGQPLARGVRAHLDEVVELFGHAAGG